MQKYNFRGEMAIEQNRLSALCRGMTYHGTKSLADMLAAVMQLYLQQCLSEGHLYKLDLQVSDRLP